MSAIIPIPRCPINIRPATMDDLPFMDQLQKIHTKQVGWMPTKQFEGKIKAGQVIVAEDEARKPVGYCIGHDQYFKHDDIGIIYQMNVAPQKQRGLIGATLLKAMFDRAAYGCKLFCCWCAQDIEANHFWESLGFVPLAFRAGSRTKGKGGSPRVHIFWQKRIREGDTTTPWWFPSQTSGGSIREDRLVFPIPPNTHWADVMPVILPGGMGASPMLIEDKKEHGRADRATRDQTPVLLPPTRKYVQFGAAPAAPPPVQQKAQKPRPEKKPKQKHDPKYVAAARELRDRYLERINNDPAALPTPGGKYAVVKQLGATKPAALLEAA